MHISVTEQKYFIFSFQGGKKNKLKRKTELFYRHKPSLEKDNAELGKMCSVKWLQNRQNDSHN